MTLALVCGTGTLPHVIATAQETAPVVCVLEGNAPEDLAADLTFRLETIGGLLADLKARDVTEVCLCGGIARPAFDPGRLDAETVPLVPVLAAALQSGDDGALRGVVRLFEESGFTVRAAHDLVARLTVAEGVLSEAAPDAQVEADAALGAGILEALAPFDVSQACVVGQGQLLSVETVAGTNALINAVPDVAATPQAILVKAPKAGQDTRVDMPTVGPDTVRAVRDRGLRGIVVAAESTIVLEPEEVASLCDAAGIVFWSRKGG